LLDSSALRLLRECIQEQLGLRDRVTDDDLRHLIETQVFGIAKAHRLSTEKIEEIVHRIFHSMRGLDILQPLIDDPEVTEIMVNSHEQIFIEKGGEISQYPLVFENKQRLEDIIQSVVGKVNRIINESTPIVDARLENGSRVNIVIPPVALKGPTMTIRKFPDSPMTMDELIERGALTEEVRVFLKNCVRAGYNIFISGGTGSGKTTFLNALCADIPKHERIITIEDSAELKLHSIDNLVSLETRNSNTEGKGEIGIRELIRCSLRMRPNRIIIGEVRGAEALDMLQAMNTGHDGSISTGHGNSVKDMLSRLETMVLSGVELPIEVIRRQIASAVDIMIHLARLRDGSRKVMEICELTDLHEKEFILNSLFEFKECGNTGNGTMTGNLRPTGNSLKNTYKLRRSGLPMKGGNE
jgi:pilus assembly protein CpaF